MNGSTIPFPSELTTPPASTSQTERGSSGSRLRRYARTALVLPAHDYATAVELEARTLSVQLAETFDSWKEEIARMWRFTKNNGITEGFHNKMEMISRRAFGFRNFENYRLRVRVLCG